MIKTILVPATGSAADEGVFASALAVGRPFAAHLDFLHVGMDAAALAVTMSSEGGGSMLVGGLLEQLEEEARQRDRRARETFDKFCAREGLPVTDIPPATPGPSAQWSRVAGDEPASIVEYGRATDLIVLARPGDDGGVAPETIETVLLDSGRPILIPPATGMAAIPQTIVIAWKATREAARAVGAALPYLALATEVRVMTVAEKEDPSSTEGERLMANLRWRGLKVSATRLEPDERSPAETLLAAAGECGALLVMGGYGHSRLRQWVFGGFTRHVLETAAAVPVLIAH